MMRGDDVGVTRAIRAPDRPGDVALVLVAILGGFAIWPAFVALGSLFDTLNGEFGWNRSQVTTAQLIYTVASVAAAPILGPLIDRFGVRPLLLTGLVLLPAALVMIGAVGRSYGYWIAVWSLASTVGQLVTPPVWAAGVARRFKRRRGLALGIAACGLAGASAVVPIITVKLAALGVWRDFYYGMAGFLALILLPLTFFFYRDASSSTRLGPIHMAVAANPDRGGNAFRRDILTNPKYWRLSAVVLLVAFVIGGMLIHMQALFRLHGMSAASAASAFALYGVGGIAGRLVGGWLLDRFDKGPLPALSMCLFPALACLFIMLGGGPIPYLYATSALLVGVSAGVEVDVIPYLARRYFAEDLFGRTYLSLAAVFVAGAGASPFLVSLLFDLTKSYDLFLLISVVASLASAVLLCTLGRYPIGDPA